MPPPPHIIVYGTTIPTEEGYYFIRTKGDSPRQAFVFVSHPETETPPFLGTSMLVMKLGSPQFHDYLYSAQITFI